MDSRRLRQREAPAVRKQPFVKLFLMRLMDIGDRI